VIAEPKRRQVVLAQAIDFAGAPDTIRTCDFCLRSAALVTIDQGASAKMAASTISARDFGGIFVGYNYLADQRKLLNLFSCPLLILSASVFLSHETRSWGTTIVLAVATSSAGAYL
jgi:hypothetical protein